MLKKISSKKSKSKTTEDTSWIVEGIVAYLRSPTWKAPVLNFVEEHCGGFSDSEENSLEHTEIHQEYKKLVEKLLSLYMKELGISEKQFSEACSIRNRDIARMDSSFEYVWAADDYLLFKRLMIKYNTEIQREALRMFDEYSGVTSENSLTNPALTEKDAESLTKMLKSSKTSISKEKRIKKQEEEDLRLAIQFSKMEMERLNELVEEEKRLLEQAIKLSLEQSTPRSTPEDAKSHALSSQARSTSANNWQPSLAAASLQIPAASAHQVSLTQPVEVPRKYDLPERFSATSLDKPITYDAPMRGHLVEKASQKPDGAKTAGHLVEKASLKPNGAKTADHVVEKASQKPDGAKAKEAQNVKTDLPPLRTPKEISSSEAASAWLGRAMSEITAEQPLQDSQKSDAIADEKLAKRREYLKQQRDKLLALKRQEREKELSEYIELKQAESSVPSEPERIDPEQEKKLASRRAVAERLKREIINKK